MQLQNGDLIDARADAVVIGVSTDLLLGASAIEEAVKTTEGGALLQKLYAHSAVRTGEVIALPGGDIAPHLLFAVITSELTPPTEELIGRCVMQALTYAVDHQARSIAFPPLGTRISHFPDTSAARATIQAIRAFAQLHSVVPEVTIVLPYDTDLPIWQAALDEPPAAPAPDPAPIPSNPSPPTA